RKMVRDLNMPIEVVGVPVQRETSGLALSSRNGYLSDAEKARAAVLYRCLVSTRDAILSGDQADFTALEEAAAREIDAAGLAPEYFSIRDAKTLRPAEPGDPELVLLTAAQVGTTRLIDNLFFTRKTDAG